jgi:threonine dehydrogenase-like Zn-dependent dehydrogenase
MRALTVVPRKKDSLAVTEVPDPNPGDGDLLVDGLAVGVCGTDKEIAAGQYGWALPGRERRVRTVGPERYVNLCRAVDVVGLVSDVPRFFSPGW